MVEATRAEWMERNLEILDILTMVCILRLMYYIILAIICPQDPWSESIQYSPLVVSLSSGVERYSWLMVGYIEILIEK